MLSCIELEYTAEENKDIHFIHCCDGQAKSRGEITCRGIIYLQVHDFTKHIEQKRLG